MMGDEPLLGYAIAKTKKKVKKVDRMEMSGYDGHWDDAPAEPRRENKITKAEYDKTYNNDQPLQEPLSEIDFDPVMPEQTYTKINMKITLGGDKIFVETDENMYLIPVDILDNISHDNFNQIHLFGASSESYPHGYNNTIVCNKIDNLTNGHVFDTELMLKVYKNLAECLKEFHSSRKSANSKAYIKD